MDAALAQSHGPARGARLLLEHCAVLDGQEPRPEANDRLRELIGRDRANLLVSALAPSRGGRYRNVA